MNRILLSLLLGLAVPAAVVELPSCSVTTANAVAQDLTPAGACIATALLSGGATDPIQILAECAGTTIDDVIQVVETLMANGPDTGADAGVIAQQLAAVHVRALGIRASKATTSER